MAVTMRIQVLNAASGITIKVSIKNIFRDPALKTVLTFRDLELSTSSVNTTTCN